MTESRHTVALHYGFPWSSGGVESHVLALIGGGNPSEVSWLILGEAEPAFAQRVAALGARRITGGEPRGLWRFGQLVRFARTLRRHNVALLHGHSPRRCLAVVLAARLARVRVVWTVHLPHRYLLAGSVPAVRLKTLAHDVLRRWLLRWLVSHTFFVSARIHADYVSRGLVHPHRSSVVPNGVDVDRFASASCDDGLRAELGAGPDAPVVCFVGRLDPQKGLDVLLSAFQSVSSNCPTCQLWLVGEGDQRGALEARAVEAGLGACVRFLGFRLDVPRLLASSDVFVLPSRFEAFSVALLEAMAAAKPVVATAVGDNDLVIRDGVSGLIVPVGDARALAEALTRMVADPELRRRLGEAAGRRAADYSVAQMVERVLAVYRSVHAPSRARGS